MKTKKDIMNILVSTNSKYLKYLPVLMASLYNNHKNIQIDLYVLYSKLNESEKTLIKDFAIQNNNKVEFLKVDENLYKGLPTTDAWSIECYFILMSHLLLPKHLDRILYLDIDLIVDNYIFDFYNISFDNNYLIACPFDDKNIVNKTFNSGVLIFNLDKFRNNITLDIYIKAAKKLNNDFWGDQELLNYIFINKTKYMTNMKYNFRITSLLNYNLFSLQDNYIPYIIHYTHPTYKSWDLYFTSEELNKFKSLEKSKSFLINKYYNELIGIWWNYAKLAPNYEQLYNEMKIKKDWLISKLKNYILKQDLYNTLYLKMLNNENIINTFNTYFLKNNINTLSIYGMSSTGKMLYKILKNTDINIIYLIDKNINIKLGSDTINIVSPYDKCNLKYVDMIIVTVLQSFDEIKNLLLSNIDFDCKIISLKDIF